LRRWTLARQFRRLSNDAARNSCCREFTLSSILSLRERRTKSGGSAALFAIENPKSKIYHPSARVSKFADAPDLGSGGAILRGSSPLPGIFKKGKTSERTSARRVAIIKQKG